MDRLDFYKISEKQFSQQVISLATIYHWEHYHTWNSLHSQKGFPDLILIRPPELLVAEVKSDNGKLTSFQVKWLQLFKDCNVEAYCWKPSDFDQIHDRLSRQLTNN